MNVQMLYDFLKPVLMLDFQVLCNAFCSLQHARHNPLSKRITDKKRNVIILISRKTIILMQVKIICCQPLPWSIGLYFSNVFSDHYIHPFQIFRWYGVQIFNLFVFS